MKIFAHSILAHRYASANRSSHSGSDENIAHLQVFHEGLKSWSCCQDVNKPVLDFDSFMKIPVCNIFGSTQIVCFIGL